MKHKIKIRFNTRRYVTAKSLTRLGGFQLSKTRKKLSQQVWYSTPSQCLCGRAFLLKYINKNLANNWPNPWVKINKDFETPQSEVRATTTEI